MSDQKTAFIEHELACLWSDLERAERHSLSSSPTIPSMEMEGIMDRISYATSIVGPVDWRNVSMVALVNGGYEAWAKYMEIDYNLPTEEELSEIKTSLEKGGWG